MAIGVKIPLHILVNAVMLIDKHVTINKRSKL